MLSSRYFTLVLLTLALPFICLAGRPLYGDVWWVLANGRLLVETGQLPQADPFTFAPHAQVYVDAQWLTQLAYYGAYRALGLEGVAVFNALAATVTFGLVLRVAWERSRNIAAATLSVLLAELTALWFLHPRAQTLAFVTFAATAYLLLCPRPRPRVLVGLGLIQAVWANLHGSFFLGPVLTILLLVGELIDSAGGSWFDRLTMRSPRADRGRVRFLVAALGVQLAATLVNPYGPNLYVYLAKFSVDPIIRDHISEWLPTAASDWPGAEFFGSVGLTLAVLGLARSRVAIADVLILLVFAILGVQAFRNIPWWGLASSPILARYVARISFPASLTRVGQYFVTSRRQVRGNLLRAGVMGLVLVGALPWARAVNPWLAPDQRTMTAADYPEAATSFLVSHRYGQHVFNDHPWGSYLDWQAWPRYQPMIDPAIEIHPADAWLDILTLAQGHASWEELADRYGVDVLLLRRGGENLLIDAANRSPRWQAVYHDDLAVIYIRSAQAEAPYAAS